MSCNDCLQQLAQQRSFQQSLLTRLGNAAMAHGYELWMRPGADGARVEVLALPLGPSVGSPQDVADLFRNQGGALALSPMQRRQRRAPIAPDVTSTPGQSKWLIKGQPDILLHFRT